jgi:hypothetical protein
VNPAIVMLRVMQIVFVASVIMFFRFSRWMYIPAQSVNVPVQWAIVACSIFTVLSGFIGQRMFRRISNIPRSNIENSDIVRPWFMGHVIRFATAESMALSGIVLRALSGPSKLVTALFAGSLLLLVVWQPGEVPAATESQNTVG